MTGKSQRAALASHDSAVSPHSAALTPQRADVSPDNAALARFYDLDLTDDPGDVELYLSLAEAHEGDVLELCAGSGRVCVPLATAGHRVTAVDRDPAMLERAAKAWAAATDGMRGPATTTGVPAARRRKSGGPAGELDIVTADVTSYRSTRRYDLAILALNSVLLLDGRDAQRLALETMAHHLNPGGRAVIDVWLPTPGDLEIYDGRTVLDWIRLDDDNHDWVAKVTSARYEPATQVAEVTTFFDAWSDGQSPRRWMRRDRIAFIGAHELVALAEQAGLSVETMAGDHALGPFEAHAERVVLVCRVASRGLVRGGNSAGS